MASFYHKASFKKQNGFTLLELITVIVLLGVISVGMGSIIKFGTQIFTEASSRDQLISSGRFAVERLNREVRNALPNSLDVFSGGSCLNFTPVVGSAIYEDIAVAPEAASPDITLYKFDFAVPTGDLFASVYPLNSDELYGGTQTPVLISTIENGCTSCSLTLNSATQFHGDSPTQRLYVVQRPITYCLAGRQLVRYQQTGFNTGSVPASGGILMAEEIDLGIFDVSQATQARNATVTLLLTFGQNDESITFNNEIQVMNAP